MVGVQSIPLVLLVESSYSKRALFVASVQCRAIRRGMCRAHATPARLGLGGDGSGPVPVGGHRVRRLVPCQSMAAPSTSSTPDGHTASMLKTIPPRVITKTIPPRVMPQRQPPRVISQPTPVRVVGVRENCRQGGRRAEDLHVARCMTGRSQHEAGRLTRRHRSNRGRQPRYGVVHPRSHDHLPLDMLGMNPGPAAIELPSTTCRQIRDIGGLTHRNSCLICDSVQCDSVVLWGAGRRWLRPRVGGVGSGVVVGGLVYR
jgi:hypothetical protein